MSYLELIGVCKRYHAVDGEVVALHDVNLSIERGEFVVLLGHSGCGKSTLLQIVAGLELASAGGVHLDSRPITHCSAERAMIFQDPNLFPWLTALENVAFGLRMAGYPSGERRRMAQQALARMSLGAATSLYPHELSGGMQQRVALARALVLDPAVLLMDEPLAALDALLRSRLQHEIRARCAGRTVLFVTHSIREAIVLADRVVILSPRPGHVQHDIVVEGTPPRSLTPALVHLEQEIESLMLQQEVSSLS